MLNMHSTSHLPSIFESVNGCQLVNLITLESPTTVVSPFQGRSLQNHLNSSMIFDLDQGKLP